MTLNLPLFDPPVPLCRPLFPEPESYARQLQDIWAKQWLTNGGDKAKELAVRLQEKLGARHLSLFCNGTLALLLGLKALKLEGEVITTPFTFPATVHALQWAGLQPVFADICPDTLTLDPAAVEAAITPRTCAILGVHVFGIPCHVEALARISARHGLKLVYDAAHAFGVEIDGRPISDFGDMSMFSLHATKLFHTAEGGALTYQDESLQRELYLLHNFGIAAEDVVEMSGINAKMNELQAAMGLCVLDLVDDEREKRKKLVTEYQEALAVIPGIRLMLPPPGVTPSYQYLPVMFSEQAPVTRNLAWKRLRDCGIMARRYFYPLCSDMPPYRTLLSAQPAQLPQGRYTVENILCLPFWGGMPDNLPKIIVEILSGRTFL